jgi:hypothetical protein
MNVLEYFLYGFSALAFGALVLLAVWYWRNENRERIRLQQTRADITDMTILFQTMRDIIGQQKAMARAFNEDMEKKMVLVKQVLTQGMERNQKLYDRQKQLEARLDEALASLESVQRQVSHARSTVAQMPVQAPAPPPTAAPEPVPAAPLAPAFLQAAAVPPPVAMPLDPWAGSDFELAEPAALPVPEAEDPPPPTPEESFSARQAFRALLDLDPVTGLEDERLPAPARENGAAPEAAGPLRQRVLEYHSAGVPIAEIARELGVGKGEVRLMLSLAKESNR